MIRRHTLAGADNRRLANLCGPLDTHLRRIEEALGVVLTRREHRFRIEAPSRTVADRAVRVLDALYASAQGPIDTPWLEQLLSREAAPDAGAPVTDASPVVLRMRHGEVAGRTPNQEGYLRQMMRDDISFGIGPAGTGKTFLAVACAVDALDRQAVQRIVLTRPAVEAGERLGFLPGDLAQKVDPYLRPLYDALYDLMGFERVGRAFEKGMIEIAPLAFMRGRTLNHAFVILDEAQNTTREQMKMFLTRLGYGSRCVVTGDTSQIDLPKGVESGLVDAERVLARVPGVGFTRFTAADVVRHPLVARIVKAYDAARRREEREGRGREAPAGARGGAAGDPAP
ncbi:MAG: PhoH family protein [Burkholderiales bacterium]|nr:PhoH family protein [Burkholderiales bacterium]